MIDRVGIYNSILKHLISNNLPFPCLYDLFMAVVFITSSEEEQEELCRIIGLVDSERLENLKKNIEVILKGGYCDSYARK